MNALTILSLLISFIFTILVAILIYRQIRYLFDRSHFDTVEKAFFYYSLFDSWLGVLDFSTAIQQFDIEAFELEDEQRDPI